MRLRFSNADFICLRPLRSISDPLLLVSNELKARMWIRLHNFILSDKSIDQTFRVMLRPIQRTLAAALLTLTSMACTPNDPAETGVDEERWRDIKAEIIEKFPEVDQWSTEQVVEALANGPEAPLVVDVRAPDEFAVSHLPGARNIPMGEDLAGALAEVSPDRPILIYCSVGYRSARASEALSAAGFTQVHNYLGSIFEWANEGESVINADGETTFVHPFDSDWGQLLRSDLHGR